MNELASASGAQSHAPIREIIDLALSAVRLDEAQAMALICCDDRHVDDLLSAGGALRERGKGREVTYSRKVFLPVTNLCRNRCSYCAFRKDPWQPGAWTMMPDEIAAWCRRARALGCKEALMCLGDKPELEFGEHRRTLGELNASSTIEYVARACELAIAQGLLPHTNAGIMTAEQMRMLRPLNASMGLMLENISPRLRSPGQAHEAAPDKDPALRMKMICEAGELRIPFTTGILLGIGETPAELASSLVAIREAQDRYGHIQEVIIQNLRAKPQTAMADASEPDRYEMAKTIATARLVLGPGMNLQAPPNLSPGEIELFLKAGLNDFGGISPLSLDYVNPEAPWPDIERLGERCARAGFRLRERLAIYREYIDDKWLDPAMASRVSQLQREIGGG
jgi:7,8-didemethyl-8-hydroxy-5-deazariboflavin synthase CofG subunit